MSDYEPPAEATRVMTPHLRPGIGPKVALDEALRRAVVTELRGLIGELQRKRNLYDDDQSIAHGLDLAIADVDDRLTEIDGND